MTNNSHALAAAARLAAIRVGKDALLDEGAFKEQAAARLAALQDNLAPDHSSAALEDASHRRQTWVGHLGDVAGQDNGQSDAPLQSAVLDASEIAARLGCSLQTTDKILSRGDIPSTVTTEGSRVATAAAVDAWIAQRDRQRATIRELAGEVQRTEGDEPFPRHVVRVHRRAVQALGSEERAARWMERRNRALGGATPRDHARTRAGADEVFALLTRIEHGVIG